VEYGGLKYKFWIQNGRLTPYESKSGQIPDSITTREVIRTLMVAAAAKPLPPLRWSSRQFDQIESFARICGKQVDLVDKILADSGRSALSPGMHKQLVPPGLVEDPELSAALEAAFAASVDPRWFRDQMALLSTSGVEFAQSLRRLDDTIKSYDSAAAKLTKSRASANAVSDFEGVVPTLADAVNQVLDAAGRFWGALDSTWPTPPRVGATPTGIPVIDTLLREAAPIYAMSSTWGSIDSNLASSLPTLDAIASVQALADEEALLTTSSIAGQVEVMTANMESLLDGVNQLDAELHSLGMEPRVITFVNLRSRLTSLIQETRGLVKMHPSVALDKAAQVENSYRALSVTFPGLYLSAIRTKLEQASRQLDGGSQAQLERALVSARRLFFDQRPTEAIHEVIQVAQQIRGTGETRSVARSEPEPAIENDAPSAASAAPVPAAQASALAPAGCEVKGVPTTGAGAATPAESSRSVATDCKPQPREDGRHTITVPSRMKKGAAATWPAAQHGNGPTDAPPQAMSQPVAEAETASEAPDTAAVETRESATPAVGAVYYGATPKTSPIDRLQSPGTFAVLAAALLLPLLMILVVVMLVAYLRRQERRDENLIEALERLTVWVMYFVRRSSRTGQGAPPAAARAA
jgi:hypothetical protein